MIKAGDFFLPQNPLSKNLRALREKSGYTQQQLAAVLNIDRSTYSYYESGKTSPDINALITLANIFSVSMDELIGQTTPETPMVYDSGRKYRSPTKKKSENSSHIYDLRKDELQLIAFFRSASPEEKTKILETIRDLLNAKK